MSEVFLDTSVLVDLCFRHKAAQENVLKVLPAGYRLRASRYVLFELARGFLRNLILLHNKAVQLERFSDLVQYATANRLHAHRLGTMLGAFADYFREGLNRKAFEPAPIPEDEAILRSFRGYLRRAIRQNWKSAERCLSEVINAVGCRDDVQPPVLRDELYHQELQKEYCGLANNCGLKNYVARAKSDFVKLRDELMGISDPDQETQRRIKSLRELYRLPNADFGANDCYSCADAIIAHEVPSQAEILTKNKVHFEPLCKVFKKTARYC